MRAVWAGAISPAPLFHQPLGKFSKIVGHEIINRRRDHHIQSISSNDVCLSEASDYLPDAKQSIHHHRPTFLQDPTSPVKPKSSLQLFPREVFSTMGSSTSTLLISPAPQAANQACDTLDSPDNHSLDVILGA